MHGRECDLDCMWIQRRWFSLEAVVCVCGGERERERKREREREREKVGTIGTVHSTLLPGEKTAKPDITVCRAIIMVNDCSPLQ